MENWEHSLKGFGGQGDLSMWCEDWEFMRIPMWYPTVQFQGPIYTHGDSPAPLPPQGMIVQPEMHLPHPGKHCTSPCMLQYVSRCAGYLHTPSSWALCCLPMRLATLPGQQTSWVPPEDFHPEPVYTENAVIFYFNFCFPLLIQVYIPIRHQRPCPIRASTPHQFPCLQDSHRLSSCLLLLTSLLQE